MTARAGRCRGEQVTIRIGHRVRVTFPAAKPEPIVATILAGPAFRKEKAYFKINPAGNGGGEIWVPAEWIEPLLRAVDE